MSIDISELKNNNIKVIFENQEFTYQRKGLPSSIFDLLTKYRVNSIEGMVNQFKTNEDGLLRRTSTMLHSPPVATRSPNGYFPINTAAKGIGFIPKEEYLEEFVVQFENLIDEAIEKGSDFNRDERLNALLNFYKSKEKITNYKLGTLELYGLRTWRNIQYDPRVSILYNSTESQEGGGRPNYISFEVKGIIEIIEKDTLAWRWQRNVHDIFHLYRAKERRAGNWPVAVLNIHVLETIDKRPGENASKEINI